MNNKTACAIAYAKILLGGGQNLWEYGAGKYGTGSCLIFNFVWNGVSTQFLV